MFGFIVLAKLISLGSNWN